MRRTFSTISRALAVACAVLRRDSLTALRARVVARYQRCKRCGLHRRKRRCNGHRGRDGPWRPWSLERRRTIVAEAFAPGRWLPTSTDVWTSALGKFIGGGGRERGLDTDSRRSASLASLVPSPTVGWRHRGGLVQSTLCGYAQAPMRLRYATSPKGALLLEPQPSAKGGEGAAGPSVRVSCAH
jgi:hypothetical protein